MGKKISNSLIFNVADFNRTYTYFYRRLKSIGISCFQWENLPEGIDSRFLEKTLFENGFSIFFRDDIMDTFFSMRGCLSGELNNYDIPVNRTAISSNGYNRKLTDKDSVIIYDNYLHEPIAEDISLFAKRLANVELTTDINIYGQRFPILITCDEKQKLTMMQLFQKYDAFEPAIFGNKGLDLTGVQVLKTDSPYVADKLYDHKLKVLHEAFSYLGVGSLEQKKARLVTSEVEVSQDGNFAQRASRLKARKQACEMINDMFGLDISVSYNPLADDMAKELIEMEGDIETEETQEGGE